MDVVLPLDPRITLLVGSKFPLVAVLASSLTSDPTPIIITVYVVFAMIRVVAAHLRNLHRDTVRTESVTRL